MKVDWEEGTANGTPGVANWLERRAGVGWSGSGRSVDNGGYHINDAEINTPFFSGTLHEDGISQFTLDAGKVQQWVNGAAPNYGFLMRSLNENAGRSEVYFSTSDSATPEARPKLIVTYQTGVLPWQGFSRVTGIPLLSSSYEVSQLSWGDMDGDGDPDIFAGQYNDGNADEPWQDPAPAKISQFWRNDAGVFTEVTGSGLTGTVGKRTGGAPADYDNDGDLDVFVAAAMGMASPGPGYLHRNNGNGTFTIVPEASFPAQTGYANGASWADYDRDGWVDLFVSRLNSCLLYHNNGNGTFSLVTNQPPVTTAGHFYGCGWADTDRDGDPDLLVGASYGGPTILYRNEGSGSFTALSSIQSGFISTGTVEGLAFGDYDSDGDPDVFIASSGTSELWRNDAGFFSKVSGVGAPSGIALSSYAIPVTWGDVDNDGDIDLFVGSYQGAADSLFLNQANGTFTPLAGAAPAIDSAWSLSAAFEDYNSDGWIDLLVGAHFNGRLLYRNNRGSNHWLKVKLTGTMSNRSAIGAEVTVTAAGKSQMRQVEAGNGYVSQATLVPHFGLGIAIKATVTVRWPGGLVQTVTNVSADQVLALTETAQASPKDAWRQQFFGTTANAGDAADTFDFDKDGLINIVEYAFALNPKNGGSLNLPEPQYNSGFAIISFTQPPGVDWVTYGAEWSSSLTSWNNIADTGVGTHHVFCVPTAGKPRLFIRLRVTCP